MLESTIVGLFPTLSNLPLEQLQCVTPLLLPTLNVFIKKQRCPPIKFVSSAFPFPLSMLKVLNQTIIGQTTEDKPSLVPMQVGHGVFTIANKLSKKHGAPIIPILQLVKIVGGKALILPILQGVALVFSGSRVLPIFQAPTL
jgi:hypothetical protein